MITVSTKGRIVIPAKIRQRLRIKRGTKLSIIEKEDSIILQPLRKYFENMAGILLTKGKLTKAIIEERAKERG